MKFRGGSSKEFFSSDWTDGIVGNFKFDGDVLVMSIGGSGRDTSD